MTQAAFDFDAPACETAQPDFAYRETAPEKLRLPKCHNMECSNTALPGRDMCRTCAERFGGYLRGKILGRRDQ